jgi:hypothetical protein
MFKSLCFLLLIFPAVLLAETPTVAPGTPLPDADKLLAQAQVVDGEYLSCGDAFQQTHAEQLNAFQGDGGKRRCAYVQAASDLLHTNISTIADGWIKDSSLREYDPMGHDRSQVQQENYTLSLQARQKLMQSSCTIIPLYFGITT